MLILTKLGQRWLSGKLRGTTLIPEDVKLITVPALAAFLVIAVISPYKSLRYVYHLQPLEALFCGCGLFSILDTLRAGTRKRILQIVCLAMVVLAFVIEPERMYSGTYKIDKELEQYSQAACVDITGDLAVSLPACRSFSNFRRSVWCRTIPVSCWCSITPAKMIRWCCSLEAGGCGSS